MAAKRGELVPRPPRKNEYEIRYATANAAKGWQDLAVTIRNSLAEAWDFLTRSPLAVTPTNYPLRGEVGTIARGGKTHERWQHKPTLRGTARIWFFVEDHTVYLERAGAHQSSERDEVERDRSRASSASLRPPLMLATGGASARPPRF